MGAVSSFSGSIELDGLLESRDLMVCTFEVYAEHYVIISRSTPQRLHTERIRSTRPNTPPKNHWMLSFTISNTRPVRVEVIPINPDKPGALLDVETYHRRFGSSHLWKHARNKAQ